MKDACLDNKTYKERDTQGQKKRHNEKQREAKRDRGTHWWTGRETE